MTNEEKALKYAKEISFCCGCNEFQYENACDMCEHRSFFETAIMALEKRVPKAVKVYDAHPCPVKLCPACGSTFVEAYGTLMKYCANCGQALKDE